MSEKQSSNFTFSDGVLQVDVPLAQMRLQWRPKPQATRLSIGHRNWRTFTPEFRLFRPSETKGARVAYELDVQADLATSEIAEQKAAAFGCFRQEIPVEILQVVEPFGSHQWALMMLVNDEPWAMDLAISNPVLAYALASSDQFRGTPAEAAAVQAHWYCHRKQRDLLEWLGFPGTEATAKVIRKIPAASASPSILRRLNHAIKSDKRVLEYLSRMEVVNSAVLELVTELKYLDLITPKLLMEVAEKPSEASIGDMIHGGMVILEEIYSRRNIRPFESVKQVCRFREEADEEYQSHEHRQELARQEAKRVADQDRKRQEMEELAYRKKERDRRDKLALQPFLPPPIPGTKDIIPLTTKGQLQDEGWEQGNCVATYLWRVQTGDTYIYRVMAPERATLSIVRGPDGCWYRSELKGKRNGKVKEATTRWVDVWLEKGRVSI